MGSSSGIGLQKIQKHVINVAISFWLIIIWELYCKLSCWCKRNTVGNGVDCASNKVLIRGEVFLFIPSLIANQVICQVSGQFADVASHATVGFAAPPKVIHSASSMYYPSAMMA